VFQKLKTLSADLTVYGIGDVAIQIVNFLLLPIYVRVVYRWGVDASFMRYYYDCHDTAARQRLASTIFFFLIVASGGIMVAGVSVAPFVAKRLIDSPGYALALRLVFLNTFLGCLSFLPFHVMRIEGRTRTFVSASCCLSSPSGWACSASICRTWSSRWVSSSCCCRGLSG
jgi:hypothetical protein